MCYPVWDGVSNIQACMVLQPTFPLSYDLSRSLTFVQVCDLNVGYNFGIPGQV